MKSSKAILPLSALVLGGLVSTADAEQTYNGAICQSDTGAVQYRAAGTPTGIWNSITGGTNKVFCATPIDHNIGNATWTIRVHDFMSTQGVSCFGVVQNANGDVVAQTPSCGTSNAFVGPFSLTCATTAGGFSSSFSHVIECNLPFTNQGPHSGIVSVTLN